MCICRFNWQVDFGQSKIRSTISIMDRFDFDDLLLVTAKVDNVVNLSSRNIPHVTVLPVEGLNVYDILNHKNLAFTQEAVALVSEKLGK